MEGHGTARFSEGSLPGGQTGTLLRFLLLAALAILAIAASLLHGSSGMGLRDALYILENRGYRVRVQGAGMVKRQSISPGVRAAQGATILIELA